MEGTPPGTEAQATGSPTTMCEREGGSGGRVFKHFPWNLPSPLPQSLQMKCRAPPGLQAIRASHTCGFPTH